MNEISVFGSSGFIGTRFCEMYPNETIKIFRQSRVPLSKNVLFLISTTDNYNVFEDPTLDIETNLVTLMDTLVAARRTYENDFVFNFVSSWFVYGNNVTLPIKETEYCNPKGIYAITKRCAEQLLISYCETFNISYRIFRLSNVLGESDKGVSKKKNALQWLIGEMAAGRDINLYFGGHFYRDYMYVDDVCEAMHLAMLEAPVNDIMHIALGVPTEFCEPIYYCHKKLGSKSKINIIEPSEFHKIVQTKDNYLDVSKLNALGFTPKFTLYDALDRIMENLK